MDHNAVSSLLAAGFNSGPYQVLLVIHLLTAGFGFGGAAMTAFAARRAINDALEDSPESNEPARPAAAAVAQRSNHYVLTRFADVSVYVAGLAGLAAVLLDDRWNFRQGWVTIGLVLYFAWVALAHGTVRPTTQKLLAALNAGGSERPAVGRLLRRWRAFDAISSLVIVAAIAVMVTKPGL